MGLVRINVNSLINLFRRPISPIPRVFFLVPGIEGQITSWVSTENRTLCAADLLDLKYTLLACFLLEECQVKTVRQMLFGGFSCNVFGRCCRKFNPSLGLGWKGSVKSHPSIGRSPGPHDGRHRRAGPPPRRAPSIRRPGARGRPLSVRSANQPIPFSCEYPGIMTHTPSWGDRPLTGISSRTKPNKKLFEHKF